MKRLAALLLSLIATPLLAATWYVDGSVAASGDGRSWSGAWKTIGNISGVAAGDTVYISGGPSGSSLTYSMSSWTPIGGSFGNPITYKIGQDGPHRGTAFFSGSGGWLSGNVHDVVISGDAGDSAMHFSLANPLTGVSPWGYIYNGSPMNRVRVSYLNCGLMTIPYRAVYINASGSSGLEFDHIYLKGTGSGADSIFTMLYLTPGLTWDQGLYVHDSVFYIPFAVGSGYGCDGISTGGGASGITVSNCWWIGWNGGGSLGQHTDGMQPLSGTHYVKIINNTYYNLPDGFYKDGPTGGSFDHYRILNNIYMGGSWGSVRPQIDGDVESGVSASLTDWLIANNVVYGTPGIASILLHNNGGSALTVSNYRCQNNVVNTFIQISPISGTATVDHNSVLTDAQFSSQFTAFSAYTTNCDFRPKTGATLVIGQGANLSADFNYDYSGSTRSVPWDLGAYAYSTVPNNTPVSTVTGSGAFGTLMPGTSRTNTIVVSNTGGGLLSGHCAITGSGFTIIGNSTYNLVGGASTNILLKFTAGLNMAGVMFFTDNGGSPTLDLSGSQFIINTMSFSATNGDVSGAFSKAGDYISQPVSTIMTGTNLNGNGLAVYYFTNTTTGNYVLWTTNNAPSDAENSLYVAIDANPSEPSDVWDMPVTAGWASGMVSKRGTGTFDTNQFVPMVYSNLTAGLHQLIVVGREPNSGVRYWEFQLNGTTNQPPTPDTNAVPYWITQQKSVLVAQGGNTTLSSLAGGVPAPAYQWKKNGTNIAGATGNTLAFVNLNTNNSGSYTLTASNVAGVITSAPATLTVAWPPYIITQPQSQAVPVSHFATLSVAAGGYEPLSYEWRFGGTVLPATGYGWSFVPNAATIGDYTVVVANFAGSVTSSVANISIMPPPPPPPTIFRIITQ